MFQNISTFMLGKKINLSKNAQSNFLCNPPLPTVLVKVCTILSHITQNVSLMSILMQLSQGYHRFSILNAIEIFFHQKLDLLFL